MPTMVARDPAYVGFCEVGHFRVGVYTQKWERLFLATASYRDLTLRVAGWATAHGTTGIRHAVYTDEDINGILVERGGSMPRFAAGVAQRLDATLLTIDPIHLQDAVFDDLSRHEYHVEGVERHNDPRVGGLAFYVGHLKLAEETSQIGGL